MARSAKAKKSGKEVKSNKAGEGKQLMLAIDVEPEEKVVEVEVTPAKLARKRVKKTTEKGADKTVTKKVEARIEEEKAQKEKTRKTTIKKMATKKVAKKKAVEEKVDANGIDAKEKILEQTETKAVKMDDGTIEENGKEENKIDETAAKESKPRVITPVTEGLVGMDDKVGPEYYHWKKLLLKKEKENYSKIYFIWQRQYWFRAIGHSALIFHYDIAKRIHRDSQLLPDKDYGAKSQEGVVNIRDMETLDQMLEKNGFQLIDANMYCRAYNAGKKYTDAELKFFQEAQHKELATVNSIVVPTDVFPHFLKLLREMSRMVYHRVAKMDRNAREVVGLEVAKKMDELLVQYSLMTRYNQNIGAKDPDEFLEYAKASMAWLQAKMGVMMDFRVMDVADVQRILIMSGKLMREIMACQAKREQQ